MLELEDVVVRQASRTEAQTVADLVAALLEELGGAPVDGAAVLRTTETLMEQGVVTGLLAFVEDAPVGVLMLNECAAIYAGGRFGEITELYVRPERRSDGVAVALLTEAERVARVRCWKRFEVGAPDQPAWARTVQFYLREGFDEVGPRLRKVL